MWFDKETTRLLEMEVALHLKKTAHFPICYYPSDIWRAAKGCHQRKEYYRAVIRVLLWCRGERKFRSVKGLSFPFSVHKSPCCFFWRVGTLYLPFRKWEHYQHKLLFRFHSQLCLWKEIEKRRTWFSSLSLSSKMAFCRRKTWGETWMT